MRAGRLATYPGPETWELGVVDSIVAKEFVSVVGKVSGEGLDVLTAAA